MEKYLSHQVWIVLCLLITLCNGSKRETDVIFTWWHITYRFLCLRNWYIMELRFFLFSFIFIMAQLQLTSGARLLVNLGNSSPKSHCTEHGVSEMTWSCLGQPILCNCLSEKNKKKLTRIKYMTEIIGTPHNKLSDLYCSSLLPDASIRRFRAPGQKEHKNAHTHCNTCFKRLFN